MKKKIFIAVGGLFCLGLVFLCLNYYSLLFARTVAGQVVGIDRVIQPNTVIGMTNPVPNAQVFSFAIAIRDKNGDITTASSEDRQWAVVEKGQCAAAKFFPYPPWELDKAGTYFGARLLKLYECKE